MIKKALYTVLILITLSTIGYAETYNVTGSVVTKNISEKIQIGKINLTATATESGKVYSEEGDLTGLVTGTATDGATILSHIAIFNKKDRFVTSGDEAHIDYYHPLLWADGSPCSFYAEESIKAFLVGLGFFKKVTDVNVVATGSISFCSPSDTNNFVLSGTLEIE